MLELYRSNFDGISDLTDSYNKLNKIINTIEVTSK